MCTCYKLVIHKAVATVGWWILQLTDVDCKLHISAVSAPNELSSAQIAQILDFLMFFPTMNYLGLQGMALARAHNKLQPLGLNLITLYLGVLDKHCL